MSKINSLMVCVYIYKVSNTHKVGDVKNEDYQIQNHISIWWSIRVYIYSDDVINDIFQQFYSMPYLFIDPL